MESSLKAESLVGMMILEGLMVMEGEIYRSARVLAEVFSEGL